MTTQTATRTAFLTDVYTCALEGGIGYWATCTSYRWSNDPRATIEAGNPHVITLDTMARGVNAIVRGAAAIPEVQRRRIAAAARTNSADTVDGSDADAIVQTALSAPWSTDNPDLRALRTSESLSDRPQDSVAVCRLAVIAE